MDRALPKGAATLTGQLLEQSAFATLVVLATIFAFERVEPVVQIWPVVLTNTEIIVLVLVALWLLSRFTSRGPMPLNRELLIPASIWLAVLGLSTLLAPAHQDKAILFMGRVLAGITVGLITADLANTAARRRTLVMAMAAGGVTVALLGLAEKSDLEPLATWLLGFKVAPTRVGDVLRVSSTLGYATVTAMVLEMVLPLLLVLGLMARRWLFRLLAAAGIVLVLSTHVLTLSRGGIISLFVVLALLAIAGWRFGRPKVMAAAAGTALLLLVLTTLVLAGNPITRLRLTTETEQLWYKARYQGPETIQAQPGEVVTVPVQVTNSGERVWTSDGPSFFALGYHLLDESGETITYDGARSRLAADVVPGETVVIQGSIVAPEEAGAYIIEWDMVQEAVTWFSWKDTPTHKNKLTVVPGQIMSKITITRSSQPTDVRVTNPSPGRLALWRAAVLMAADYPLFGVGPDSFRWSYGEYAGVTDWDTGIHANNLYLEWLAGTGIVGLLAFLWLSSRLAKLGLSRLRFQKSENAWLMALGLAAGLATWYVHGFVDFFYEFTPAYLAFWLLVGLLAAMPSSSIGKDDHAPRI